MRRDEDYLYFWCSTWRSEMSVLGVWRAMNDTPDHAYL